MTVLVVENAPWGLRGLLTRWLLEVHPGVFVGTPSARVRDKLWEAACGKNRTGGCVLLFRAQTEQGFAVRTYGETRRQIIDIDGLLLVQKPIK